MKLNKFELSYIETIFWSSLDVETDRPMEDLYSIDDISQKALNQIRTDCEKFQEKIRHLKIDESDSQIAHDFWLTRNHHGAGFWDGDYPKKLGEELTKISHEFGEVFLYRGDDGKLYF